MLEAKKCVEGFFSSGKYFTTQLGYKLYLYNTTLLLYGGQTMLLAGVTYWPSIRAAKSQVTWWEGNCQAEQSGGISMLLYILVLYLLAHDWRIEPLPQWTCAHSKLGGGGPPVAT